MTVSITRRLARRTTKLRLLALALMGLAASHTSASEPAGQAEGLGEALRSGTMQLDTRLRFEHVHQDNALDDAFAGTIRARLGYATLPWHGFSSQFIVSATGDLSGEAFNSTRNGEVNRSVVADPEGTRVDSLNIAWQPAKHTRLQLGRQRLVLDDARFVGDVGWRQTRQSFDAFHLDSRWLPATRLQYVWLQAANTIFLRQRDLDGHLVHLGVQAFEGLELTAYGHWLDFEDAAPTDQRTLGLRAAGTIKGLPAAAVPLRYHVEYARQDDYRDAPAAPAQDYLRVELGTTVAGLALTAGYERLGGDGGSAFQTPLATLHAFQGWADIFLNTPPDGVRDVYGKVATTVSGTRLVLVYHDFDADAGSANHGRELGALVSRELAPGLRMTLKWAEYRAQALAVDTRKIWLLADHRF